MRRIVVAIVLASALAGCAKPAGSSEPGGATTRDTAPEGLQFPPLLIRNTPQEVRERPSEFMVSYQGGRVGLASPESGEFPTAVVREGDSIHVSYAGKTWTTYDWSDPKLAGISGQIAAFDLRLLLSHPSYEGQRIARDGAEVWSGKGIIHEPDADVPYEVEVESREGRVVRATVQAPTARESPFTFAPLAGSFPFAIATPAQARRANDITSTEDAARDAHVTLIGLVSAYARNHAGLLPETLDESSLRLELATSGASWPRNPYTSAPMVAGVSEGHFGWVRCAPDRGHYVGYGWDAPLVEQRWGTPQCASL